MTTPSTNLTIFHDAKEWNTDIEGEIGEIRVDGRRLDDIHDLSSKLERSNMYIMEVTKRIKRMAYIATALAIMAVISTGYIGGWLVANQDEIAQKLSSKLTDREVEMLRSQRITLEGKLKTLGWEWKNGSWQRIGNTALRGRR